MAIWGGFYAGYVMPPLFMMDPISWHAHEMIYGFTMAIVAGFLLTAVANWTGGAPARQIHLAEVLRYLFPNGRQLKREFQIGSLQGEKGQSLKVTMSGDRAGLWQDFESSHGGDIFDLWAAVHALDTQRDFPAVLRSCADWLGFSPVVPPVSLERREWIYTDASGKPLVTIKRTDGVDGKKTFLPYDHIVKNHAMPEIRPLYNLRGIIASDHVIITEGEKCAQALIDLGIPATTVMGGANFDLVKTDFSPLAGKDITIWPDNDKAGQGYVERLKTGLQSIKPRVQTHSLNPEA